MNWPDSTSRAVLGILAVGAFLFFVGAILVWGTTRVGDTITGLILGYLAATLNSVYGYYFGSSSGSTLKSELLAGKKE